MPEISNAVTEAFCKQQGTDVFESNRSIVSFITEGLLTHFFCYYDKPDSRNILWFLEYVNKQKHLLGVQLPHLSAEEVNTALLSSSDTDGVPLSMLKYFLLRILGSCSERKEGMKQWVPPYETEVNYTILE